MRYYGNKIKELYNLNSSRYDGISTRARLCYITKMDQHNDLSFTKKDLKQRKFSRIGKILKYLEKHDYHLSKSCDQNIELQKLLNDLHGKLLNWKRIMFFTDGSTKKNGEISGIGIVAVNQLDLNSRKFFNFSMNTYGNNFFAELFAIAICILIADNIEYCEIWTDSESSIQALNLNCSERQWTRTPLSEWIKPLSTILRYNKNIKLNYVRAHTEQYDFYSKSNSIADNLARKALFLPPYPLILPNTNHIYLIEKQKYLLSGVKNDGKTHIKKLHQQSKHL